MLAVRRRPVRVGEVVVDRRRRIDRGSHRLRGRRLLETKLHRAQRGRRDGEHNGTAFRTARADQQDFGPAKMRQSEASEGVCFFQRVCWQMNAA